MNLQNSRNWLQAEGAALLYPSQHIVIPNEAQGPYYASADKRYEIGDVCYTSRGKFRYFYATGECRTGFLAAFMNVIGTVGIDWSALVQAQQAGDKTVTMTSPVAQTNNSMLGGSIVINAVPPDAGNQYVQQRTVVANTPCIAGGTTVLTLDYGLERAVTTASYAFVMPNPYSSLKTIGPSTALPNVSFAGVPAVPITGAGYYSWLLTRGRCWITDEHASLGATDYMRQLVADEVGALAPHITTTTGSYTASKLISEQHVGFIIDNNTSHNGMTEVFINCDID